MLNLPDGEFLAMSQLMLISSTQKYQSNADLESTQYVAKINKRVILCINLNCSRHFLELKIMLSTKYVKK